MKRSKDQKVCILVPCFVLAGFPRDLGKAPPLLSAWYFHNLNGYFHNLNEYLQFNIYFMNIYHIFDNI